MAKGRGRARRAARREERNDRRTGRRDDRRQNKLDKRQQRMDARQMRAETRQGGKTDRSALRTSARETAYENGIDPNAWVGDSITGVANAASQFGIAAANAKATTALGGNGGVPSAPEGAPKSASGDGGGGDVMKMALPLGLGLLALKFLK